MYIIRAGERAAWNGSRRVSDVYILAHHITDSVVFTRTDRSH